MRRVLLALAALLVPSTAFARFPTGSGTLQLQIAGVPKAASVLNFGSGFTSALSAGKLTLTVTGGSSNATQIQGTPVTATAPTTQGQFLAYDGTSSYLLTTVGNLVQADGTTLQNSGGTLGVKNGGIGSAQIATGAVGSTALAANAVTTSAIANANVTAAKLASGAALSNIGTVPIANGGTNLASAGGTANRVLLTTDGTTFGVGQITGQMIAGTSTFATYDVIGRVGAGSITVTGIAATDKILVIAFLFGTAPTDHPQFTVAGANTINQGSTVDLSACHFELLVLHQ